MKNLILLFSFVLSLNFVNAQCNHDEFIADCKEHLLEDNFKFIKTFDLDNTTGEAVEHSFMLSHVADYEYYFTGFDWEHHTMKATLYDSNHNVIATNKTTDNEYIHVIRFTPKEDAIYYIKFEFTGGAPFCGSAVLGFHMHKD